MTELPETNATAMAAFTDYIAREADRDRLRAELLPANKAAIFDALAPAGITTVVVVFDGGGDSGQIELVDALSETELMSLPGVTVEIASSSYTDGTVNRRTASLQEAIETIAYDLLSATFGGWENNDGAYGEFTFDVATRVISLDFNGRYVAVASSSHEF